MAQQPTITTPSVTNFSHYINKPSSALSITASVEDGGQLTYKWQSSADNSTWSDIYGATSSAFTPKTSDVGVLYYHCVVTNTLRTIGKTPSTTLYPSTELFPTENFVTTTAIATSPSFTVTIRDKLNSSEREIDYLNQLRTSYSKICRLRFLQPDGSTAFAIDNNPLNRRSGAFLQSGQLSANMQNGSRYTASVTLSNVDSEFDYNVNNLWFGSQVAIDEGLILSDGTDYYIQQGVFYIDTPSQTVNPDERTITYPLVDKWSALDGTISGNLESTYEVPAGTNIFEPIETILQEDKGNGQPVDNVAPVFTEYYNDQLDASWTSAYTGFNNYVGGSRFVYNNGIYAASHGTNCVYTTDFVTFNNSVITDIEFVVSKLVVFDGWFVCCTVGRIFFSTNCVTWNMLILQDLPGRARPCVGGGNILFSAPSTEGGDTIVSYFGQSLYSLTKYVFTSSGSSFYPFSDIAYGNGVFCAITLQSNSPITTVNGMTWLNPTSFPLEGGSHISFGNGVFVYRNYFDLETETSQDGRNWTHNPQPNGIGNVSFGNGVFFSAYMHDGNCYISVSQDGVNWNRYKTDDPLDFYRNYKNFAISHCNNIFTVTDGQYPTPNNRQVLYISDSFSPVTDSPYTLRIDSTNGTIANVITGMTDMVNGLVGYDKNGTLRVDPSQDDISDNTKPVLWQFSLNEAQLLGLTYSVKNTDVYNDYIIVGEALDGDTQPAGRAQDLDPSSDTNVNIIGRKTYRESSSGYYTNRQCADYAAYKLKRSAILQKSVDISCIQMFHIDLNSIVTIVRTDKTGSPVERHLITGYSRPLATTRSMTINATSVIDLPIATITTVVD